MPVHSMASPCLCTWLHRQKKARDYGGQSIMRVVGCHGVTMALMGLAMYQPTTMQNAKMRIVITKTFYQLQGVPF